MVVTTPVAYAAWMQYSKEHVESVAGFVIKRNIHNRYTGQVIGQSEEGVIPWDDKEKLYETLTTVIPYDIWEWAQREILKDLLPVVKEVELIIASYLHQEGIEYKPASSEAGMTVEDDDAPEPQLDEMDIGNFDGL